MKINKKNNFDNKLLTLSLSDIHTIFANVNLFQNIANDEGIIKLAKSSKIMVIEDGNTLLMEEGVVENQTYIMLFGDAEILIKNLAGDAFVVATLHADMKKKNVHIVGEISLLNTDQKRSATVKILTKSTFLVIENKMFVTIIKEYPHIGLHVYKKICESLQTRLERSNKNTAALFKAYVNEILPD